MTERRLVAFAALTVLVVIGLRLGGGRLPWSQDETDLVSLAVGLAEDAHLWLRPDYHPLALETGAAQDAAAPLGHGLVAPPLASALMALPSLLGVASNDAWPVLGAALLLLGIADLARTLASLGDEKPPPSLATCLCWTLLVVALSPRAIVDTLTLEAEIPMAGLASLGLARAIRARTSADHAGAGALLGLAFLAKLWLVGPPALAALAVAYRRPRDHVGALVLGAALVATAHLALVATLDPASLATWLREVYFGGILSTKLAGVAAHPEWAHGPLYYPAAIARELGGALVVLAAAALSSSRAARAAWVGSPAGRAAAGMAASVAVLSVPAIKEPLYVLPAVALGLAMAVAALARPRAPLEGLRRLVPVAAIAVALAVPRPAAAAGDVRLAHLAAR